LSNLATASQPPSEQAGASAIFNVMRNLGGSIGIAALSTFITFREQYHFSIIGNWLTQNSQRTARLIDGLTHALGSATPGGDLQTHTRAVAQVAVAVRREAFVIGVALVLCIFALALIRRGRRASEAVNRDATGSSGRTATRSTALEERWLRPIRNAALTAAQPALVPSLSRRDYPSCCLAVSRPGKPPGGT
jgi:hypothetical protein